MNKPKRIVRGALLIAAAGLSLPATGRAQAWLHASPATRPTQGHAEQTLLGSVQSYNFDDRGHCDGLLIKIDGGAAQLNVPPGEADGLMAAAPIGADVKAVGVAESHAAVTNVFRLKSLDGPADKHFEVAGPDDWDVIHVEGTIKSLNRTPRGETDGMILDTGDLVRVDSHDIDVLKPTVGQTVSVDGWSRPMDGGHHLVEATKVNGQRVSRPQPPRPMMDGRGPMFDRHRGPTGGNRFHTDGDDFEGRGGPPIPPPGN